MNNIIIIFDKIVKINSEETVYQSLDEVIPDFLDEGWEDDFENEYEAYQEMGRGEAEHRVLSSLIIKTKNEIVLTFEEFNDILTLLYEHYHLKRN